ncbi:MAG: hypothetical protein DRO87_05065 [Candidatus Thorarchaeota archaeon]|nr:MAG: hypothetical protein DRP09_11845 [Candidatus Thorarchaeota archaeon]RLI58687.1 MAG: hypothetical protein DRO87_05065 [Candidatus Thorarchaeota archaeon]
MLNGPKRYGLPSHQTRSFVIGVCEDHDVNDAAEERARVLVMLLASLMGGSVFLALMFAGSQVASGGGLPGWVPPYIAVLLLSLILGYWAFRPNALESAVKIVGFDFDVQNVWLHIKSSEYLRRLLEENPMNVELVNWVVKA